MRGKLVHSSTVSAQMPTTYLPRQVSGMMTLRKKYSKVIEKLDAHFKVRRNVIFERARFNKRDQLESESAEEYITALYSLVETCDYGTMKDEMLRDRLVVGVHDAKVSKNSSDEGRPDARGSQKDYPAERSCA